MSDMRKALEDARAAIEPFAKRADRFDPAEGDDCNLAWGVNFEIGELRAARTILTRIDAALAALSETGPLFVGSPVPIPPVLAQDELWKLLAAGNASPEDQRYAAGWIAALAQGPET